LRFDLPGIGDSDGKLLDASDYQHKFIDHKDGATAAVDFMHDEVGIEELGFIGLCGGAFGALRAGVAISRIRFLILLSLPVEELGDLSEDSVQSVMLRQYLRNALQWRSWRNLFLLRTNFRMMGKAMTKVRHIHKQFSMVDESLWSDFRRFTESRPVLLLYGDSDPLCKSFQNAYVPRIEKLNSKQRERCTSLIIEKANHTFSKRHWQQHLAEATTSWLAQINAGNKNQPST
jgi:pimeloyl-ACP methyl ester carboxylesterase